MGGWLMEVSLVVVVVGLWTIDVTQWETRR